MADRTDLTQITQTMSIPTLPIIKVVKFGGTSLADAEQFKKAAAIIKQDPSRKYVVVSAPGKRFPNDTKVTDLLLAVANEPAENPDTRVDLFRKVMDRFNQIVHELDIFENLNNAFLSVLHAIQQGIATKDFILSRGEYFSAWIMTTLLNSDIALFPPSEEFSRDALDRFQFLNSADFICFDEKGNFDQELTDAKATRVGLGHLQNLVIPGFYGAMPDGKIKTFSRGGSDVTGAIVARLVNATLYENWTDVDGILMADPRIVDEPNRIETITYRELRELSYMGASVLHDEAVFPVRKAKIPINIRNTNNPTDPGTMIVPDEDAPKQNPGAIVGIAGRKNFTVITVEKTLMNHEVGFMRKLCTAFERLDISIEHMPSGIDTISVIVEGDQLADKGDVLMSLIYRLCNPDNITVQPGLAMICTVGHSMAQVPGVSAKLLKAVADEEINIRMLNQGSSELSIIIGVDDADYDKAVRAIYRAFTAIDTMMGRQR
jgi:aspartate kinase